MSIGLFVGSFDPFTNGHYEIVNKSLKVFDKVVIGIGVNENKKRFFEKELMLNAIKELFNNEISSGKIDVVVYDNLTAELARQVNAIFIIRGIRNTNDYNYEKEIAKINETLFGLDTMFFRTSTYSFISSTMVRDLYVRNKDVSQLVPKQVLKVIENLQ